MASVNWQKIKSASTAGAKIKHNDKAERVKCNHSNDDIDKSRTYLNLDLLGRSYKSKIKAYKDRVNYCKSNMQRVRSDAVTLIGLNIKVPDDLSQPIPSELKKQLAEGIITDVPEELKNQLYQKQCDWIEHVYPLVRDFVGADNVISATADFDEIHAYYDTHENDWILSRPELDVKFVPEIDGKLNAKKFQTRGSMTSINNIIEKETQRYYGFSFMNGKEARKQHVDTLKKKSMTEQIKSLEKRLSKAQNEFKSIFDNINIAEAKKKAIEDEIQAYTGWHDDNWNLGKVKEQKNLFGKVTGYIVPKEIWDTQVYSHMDYDKFLRSKEQWQYYIQQVENKYKKNLRDMQDNKELKATKNELAKAKEQIKEIQAVNTELYNNLHDTQAQYNILSSAIKRLPKEYQAEIKEYIAFENLRNMQDSNKPNIADDYDNFDMDI